eukprot:GFUD01012479.1.p1 GENE.GFUD01012479.1~~GFUD01012479.1.p1  ORF type:complete len:204 (+),score=53.54 GFUD01012479.1:134-745(+)
MEQAEKSEKSVDELKGEEVKPEYDVGTPCEEDLFVSNGLEHSIWVEVRPTNLVRKYENPMKKFLRWFDFQIVDWESQVDHKEGSLHMLTLEMLEVKPHTVGIVHMGKDNDDKWMLRDCSVQLTLWYKAEDKAEGNRELTFTVIAPGDGVIATPCNGSPRVEQAQVAKWWRSLDHWVIRQHKVSNHPHLEMKKGSKCSVCGVVV